MLINHPKISIVIVVRNSVETIENAILSVIQQNYTNYELIIKDGLSTDGTIDIINRYRAHITFLSSEKDLGIYDAMNKSLKKCSGNWIYFLGADDELFNPQVLYNLFSSPREQNDVLYGNAYYIHRKKLRFGKVNRYMLSKHNINHQTLFYPKSVFEKYSFNTSYPILADYYLNLHLFFKSNYHFRFIPQTIAKFNDLGSSGTQKDHQFEADKINIVGQLFPIDVLLFYKLRQAFIFLKDLIQKK